MDNIATWSEQVSSTKWSEQVENEIRQSVGLPLFQNGDQRFYIVVDGENSESVSEELNLELVRDVGRTLFRRSQPLRSNSKKSL